MNIPELRDADWIAEHVFKRTAKKEIRSKAAVLRRQAKKGIIPHRRQGVKIYFNPSDFNTEKVEIIKPGDRKTGFFG